MNKYKIDYHIIHVNNHPYPCRKIQLLFFLMASKFQLTEQLSITLMTRFLNHLDLLDDVNVSVSVEKMKMDEHADAVLRNLLAVGKFLGEREDIKWIGSKKRQEKEKEKEVEGVNMSSDSEDEDEEDTAITADTADTIITTADKSISTSPHTPPMAFIVLMDKICKIGRKCRHTLPISTCLKFYAAILLSCERIVSEIEFEPAVLAVLKLIDHVQTFSISRDQVRGPQWRSCLDLASTLLTRLKSLLGEDRHAALNLLLVKSMSKARIERREEKRRMVMMEPERAARIKAKGNQKKYKARKKSASVKAKMV